MKGRADIVEYAGFKWRLSQLAEVLAIEHRYLGRWYRAGKLTPARVELYRHRKRLREVARSNSITAKQVSVRVARGMDRYQAATQPLRPPRGYGRKAA
jgi:hypothetical protein